MSQNIRLEKTRQLLEFSQMIDHILKPFDLVTPDPFTVSSKVLTKHYSKKFPIRTSITFLTTELLFHFQLLNSKVTLMRFLEILAWVTVGGPCRLLRRILKNIEDELQLAGSETLVVRVTLHHARQWLVETVLVRCRQPLTITACRKLHLKHTKNFGKLVGLGA